MDWHEQIQTALTGGWARLRDTLLHPRTGVAADEKVALLASRAAPVIWLLGKVQSGKTSIVRALTDATAAEIGLGYKPCTRTAALFDFPAEAPVIRFLDTRGIGEINYDPADDMRFHEAQAHVLLVVMKALDPQQDQVVEAVRAIRKRHPEWPVVVAQTTLHEAYPGGNHPKHYPFAAPQGLPLENGAVSPDLARSLAYQRSLFANLPGNGPLLFVPLDFTQPGDGFEPRDYGLPALLAAFEKAAPAGLLAALKDASSQTGDRLANEAHPHIVGYATAAAVA